MTRCIAFLMGLSLLATVSQASQVEALRVAAKDAKTAADRFYDEARRVLVQGGGAQNQFLQAAHDLHLGTNKFYEHFFRQQPQADQLNADLGIIDHARQGVERLLPASGAPSTLRARWKRTRVVVDEMLRIAAGDEGDGAQPEPQAGPVAEPDAEAPQAPAQPPPPAAVTRLSLIGNEEMKFASQDLSGAIDQLADAIGEQAESEPGVDAAMEKVSQLRAVSEAIGVQASLEAARNECAKLGQAVVGVDQTVPRLRAYRNLRPLWVSARGLAMGLYKHVTQ